MASDTLRSISQSANRSHGSFELVLSPVILGLIGFWADGRLGTRPVLTVTAVVLAIAGASAKLYLEYTHRMRVLDDERRVSGGNAT